MSWESEVRSWKFKGKDNFVLLRTPVSGLRTSVFGLRTPDSGLRSSVFGLSDYNI
jgi:hypothetical protein